SRVAKSTVAGEVCRVGQSRAQQYRARRISDPALGVRRLHVALLPRHGPGIHNAESMRAGRECLVPQPGRLLARLTPRNWTANGLEEELTRRRGTLRYARCRKGSQARCALWLPDLCPRR